MAFGVIVDFALCDASKIESQVSFWSGDTPIFIDNLGDPLVENRRHVLQCIIGTSEIQLHVQSQDGVMNNAASFARIDEEDDARAWINEMITQFLGSAGEQLEVDDIAFLTLNADNPAEAAEDFDGLWECEVGRGDILSVDTVPEGSLFVETTFYPNIDVSVDASGNFVITDEHVDGSSNVRDDDRKFVGIISPYD